MPYQNEFASGDSLWRLSENLSVKEFQGMIRSEEVSLAHELPTQLIPRRDTDLAKRIIAIDSSTVTDRVKNGYTGAEAALFHLAAVVIELDKIRGVPSGYVPGPAEVRSWERCHALSAVLPGRNIVRKDMAEDSPARFFRATVNEEMKAKLDPEHETLMETMRAITPVSGPITCPMMDDCRLEYPDNRVVPPREGVSSCACSRKETIYETDSLRVHERFDENGPSEQAFTAFRQVVEHLTLVNVLRYFEKRDSLGVLRDTAFIMDGPLAIFGMPARLKTHIQSEIARIHDKALRLGHPGVLLIGVEKTGRFLEHLEQLDWMDGIGPRHRLPNKTALAPDLDYIHKHIALRPPNAKPYGLATYYGRKVLYKSRAGQHSVLMTPIVNKEGQNPHSVNEAAYPRIGEVLNIMDELATHLYEDAFAPLVRAHAHAAIPLRAGERILSEIFGIQ